jgi:hypothetical protein
MMFSAYGRSSGLGKYIPPESYASKSLLVYLPKRWPGNVCSCKLLWRKCNLYGMERQISLVAKSCRLSIFQNPRWPPNGHLEDGQYITFYPDGLKSRVIPQFKGFWWRRVHFWGWFVNIVNQIQDGRQDGRQNI